jgi:hypothetical protein
MNQRCEKETGISSRRQTRVQQIIIETPFFRRIFVKGVASCLSYLLVPPADFKSLMADKNCIVETKRVMRLSERVIVVRVTEKLETLTNSLALIGVTRVDETPFGEESSNLALSSLEGSEMVGEVLLRKTIARRAIIMDKRDTRAREMRDSLNPLLCLLPLSP